MARIRTIKPEFWLNEELASISEGAHLLAVALLNYADDQGLFNANPNLVKATCFPLRKLSVPIEKALIELASIGYIVIGKGVDGRDYGRIVNFIKHQIINRPTSSKISCVSIAWEPENGSTHGGLTEDSLRTHGGLTDGSLPEGKGRERKGKEGNGSELSFETKVASEDLKEVVGRVLDRLNEHTGCKYRTSPDLMARAKDMRGSYEFEIDALLIVDHKCNQWLTDPKMSEFLRPSTLFCKSHWEEYLPRARKWDADGRPKSPVKGKVERESISELYEGFMRVM